MTETEKRYAIEVSLTNESREYRFSDWTEPIEEPWLLDDDGNPDFGAIYRQAQRNYGVCRSSVFVDGPPTRRVGWYFEKRAVYDEDRGGTETYLQGAWVTVVEIVEEAQPEIHRKMTVGPL